MSARKPPEPPTHRIERREPSKADRRSLLVVASRGVSWHTLPEAGTVVLGRGEEADLRIADSAISRVHARLEIGPDLRITDLGSANGVFVHGEQLRPDQSVRITPGDVVELGNVTVIVQTGSVTPGRDGWIAAADGPAVLVPPPGLRSHGEDLVAEDPAMHRAIDLVRRVAPSGITVLLVGETGVGKEVMASLLHEGSGRAGRFVKVNCAALAPALVEAELFGHERGAFTGADQSREGLLEAASCGTLLFDEVGELPPELQAKLLRVIEEREVLRVGGREPRPIDVRFVAATNRDLLSACATGQFRQDLYYRLNGIRIDIPPLRQRPLDLPPLATRFLAPTRHTLSEAATELLLRHAWPGNVRELRNTLERAALLAGTERLIDVAHLPGDLLDAAGAAGVAEPSAPDGPPRGATERERILDALARTGGNQTRAAQLLGVSRRTLVSRIREHRITRPRKGYGKD